MEKVTVLIQSDKANADFIQNVSMELCKVINRENNCLNYKQSTDLPYEVLRKYEFITVDTFEDYWCVITAIYD